ncbi:MAG: translation elongation factor Ts [Chloroflexota bacterium]|nr:translation elongation factor Ts [Chloroflexota bacterium]
MANISAAEVKKLRDATGVGMMTAKKALEEADGDFDQALEILRIKGETKVKERGAERTAANGLVAAADGAMIMLNSETDFVAKNEQFQQLAADIVAHAAKSGVGDVMSLLSERLSDGRSVQQEIDALAAVIGEKLELTKLALLGDTGRHVVSYLHRRSSDLPPQLGVLVEFDGDDVETARGVAMHIVAMTPRYVSRDEVPEDVVANERRIAEATAREEGKPEQALPKIVEGRVNSFFKEFVLLEQPSVQDGKKTVKAILDETGITVHRFERFEVGAG